MATTQFPINNFLGTQTFGPVAVPQGLTHVVLALDGTNMTNPAMLGSLTLDLSLDGGVTWASDAPGPETGAFPIGMEFVGGAKEKDQITPLRSYNRACDLPHPELTTRRVRGTVTVSGVPLTTTATLTTS